MCRVKRAGEGDSVCPSRDTRIEPTCNGALAVKVDIDPFAETRRIVVAQGLGIAKRLQHWQQREEAERVARAQTQGERKQEDM